ESGNAWYRVQLSDSAFSSQPILISNSEGEILFDSLQIAPGTELYLNAGINADNVELKYRPYNAEEAYWLGDAVINMTPFEPQYVPRNGISLTGSTLSGVLRNEGDISAYNSAIALDYTTIDGGIVNAGNITARDTAIDIKNSSTVGDLINEGVIISENSAAIRVDNSSIGTLTNIGSITGGEVVDDELDEGRIISDGSTVALDFRLASSSLDLINGSDTESMGIINGAIYGTTSDEDHIELVAGEINGDIFDIETIDVTGTGSLSGDIFSFGNTSRVNIASTGALLLGTNSMLLEGDYNQAGSLSIMLNQNTQNFDSPRIDVYESVTFEEGSTISLNVEDRNIANFNPSEESPRISLLYGDDGVFDNGVNIQSDSLLFNYNTYIDGGEFGVDSSINDLGVLSLANGAGLNGANALSTLQGENSDGLVNLYTSNPDLYNLIYDVDLADLPALANALVSGNPVNSVVLGLNAQNEVLNTILARISDLRTGTTGISAGDNGSIYDYRPDSMWIRALYSEGRQEQQGDFSSYNLRSTGFTLGADKDINDYLTLGFGVTMLNSTANSTSNGEGSDSTTDSYLGSLYFGWRNQDYFIDANVGLGFSKNDLTGTSVGSGSVWESNFDSKQLSMSVLAGKSFLFNDNDSLLEPSIGINFTQLKTDSYSYESTSVDSTSFKSLELGAGIRYITSFDVKDGQLLPEASLMAWHDFEADAVEADITFENSGDTFTYFGPDAVKNRFQASVGTEYWMDNNITLSVNLDHNWQSDFKSDTVQARLRYDF
ncbi:MAG: autotransporter domain-containing protein, partial [Endozoicomonas sp.]